MTPQDPILQESLSQHEGERFAVYRCPAGYLTVGKGHQLGIKVSEDTWRQMLRDNGGGPRRCLNLVQSHALFVEDIRMAIDGAGALVSADAWADAGLERQRVLVEMVFQMGATRVRGFRNMLAAWEVRDWERAAAEMLDSKWAKTDTPERAHRLAARFLREDG